MTPLLLGTAVLLQYPSRRIRAGWTPILLLLAAGPVLYLSSLPAAFAGAMACAVVLALLSFGSTGPNRSILSASSVAVAVFGVYRLAVTSIPWFWLAADSAGYGLGRFAGLVTSRPLSIGATFAGLDFLVLTVALCILYLPHTHPPLKQRGIDVCAGILLGHLLYLMLLSYVPALLAALPPPVQSANGGGSSAELLRKTIPWNLPALACGVHLLVIGAVFRWSPWSAENSLHPAQTSRSAEPRSVRQRSSARVAFAGAIAGALIFPVIAVLYPASSSLQGKRIVFYEKGFLNWLKPTHGSYGRLSSGMYGMLPSFVESLGAQTLMSSDLTDADLTAAEALVVIFPDEPWQDGQLRRIHNFVQHGGSLLVLGEHTTRDETGSNRFNELLTPTAMQVGFDSATFAVGGWLQSYEAISHPMTAGIKGDLNEFGVVIGASVKVRWPARPVLVGRWGWADEGDEASSRAMMGNDLYDCGEKLGDVVLVAEQPVGKGRVVSFGDTSSLTNAINVSSCVFTSRLFAYLAGPAAHPAWRQSLAILTALLLTALLCWKPTPLKTSLVVVTAMASFTVCTAFTQRGTNPLPEGRRASPNNLAYINASHIGAYSGESWRPDGIGGLALTLMRNGYLTMALHELTAERLGRAGLLIVIAPSRCLSREQVETVRAFVRSGGILIMAAGYERAGASTSLLNAFGLRIGSAGSGFAEPTPLGHFKSPYLESDGTRVYVRFHAAWPIACTDPNAHVIAYGPGNLPVILMQRLGTGKVVFIGDTCFAMNQNLEYENGAAFEGLRENADFWRWLLTVLRDEPMWIPAALQKPNAAAPVTEEARP